MFLCEGKDLIVQRLPFFVCGTKLHDFDEDVGCGDCVACLTGLFFEDGQAFDCLRESEVGDLRQFCLNDLGKVLVRLQESSFGHFGVDICSKKRVDEAA